jgi:hypothetical protein
MNKQTNYITNAKCIPAYLLRCVFQLYDFEVEPLLLNGLEDVEVVDPGLVQVHCVAV